MGGIVKSVVGAITGKSGAKGAYQAQLRGLQGAVDEQRKIYEDISGSQAGLRDTNIADIEALSGRTGQEYDQAFGTVSDLLQQQFDQISGLQDTAFTSNEERLLANLDDILARSQQSFDYAQENLMPYIKQGRDAFQQFADKAQKGFEYQPFTEQFQSPEPFQYDDFQFDYRESPGYQFARDQALEAATNTQAAQGMGLSGATLKALQDRASGLAAQDYGNQFNRAMTQYQMDRDRDYREYSDAYNRSLGEFGTRYDIDRANQQGAYQNYLNELNTLSGLGNVGLAGDQSLIQMQAGLADFENQARTALSQALSQNDFARAEAMANNILRLTGGQGELAMQASQIRNQIDQAKTSNIIDQRSTAQSNIDRIRGATGSNISNLEANKGQAEANYLTERSKLQGQLLGGLADAGMMLAGGALGGAGAFGGGGGMSGAMGGLNFGAELANFTGSKPLSPQATNFMNTGFYTAPQQQMMISPTNYGMGGYPNAMGTGQQRTGTGASWLGGF